MTIAEARQQFPYLGTGRIYLNHAATSPWSLYMSRKVDSFREGRMLGAIDTYHSTIQCINDTRERVASMIGSEPECISFIQNTTEGLNVLAAGLDWKQGDQIILFEQEFPANVYPFLNLKRHGVEIRFVPQRNGRYDFNDIEAALTPRTRLVAISWVQFLSGYRVDLGALSTLCRQRGVLLSVDGIQGVGAIRMNLRETPVDFVSAGVQKWQMGPQGLAVIHVSHELRGRIHQAHLGWMSTSVPFNFFPYN
jgi:selenocysteine lyase/cysteine desulfurase